MGIGSQAYQAAAAGARAARDIFGAFGKTFNPSNISQGVRNLAKEVTAPPVVKEPGIFGKVAGMVGGAIGGTFNWVIVKPINFLIVNPAAAIMGGSAKAGLWVAKKPIEAGLYGVRKGFEGFGSVFRNHPGLAVGGTLVAAAAGVGLWARNRAERDTMESYQQAAMQMQAMRSPYMNSVTPQEYAAMEARMRQGGDGGSSMAQAEQQRRAAAQQAAAPAAS
jgi:hypothetical protein